MSEREREREDTRMARGDGKVVGITGAPIELPEEADQAMIESLRYALDLALRGRLRSMAVALVVDRGDDSDASMETAWAGRHFEILGGLSRASYALNRHMDEEAGL